jgi:DNA replication ATP-dependent helicase Dna2
MPPPHGIFAVMAASAASTYYELIGDARALQTGTARVRAQQLRKALQYITADLLSDQGVTFSNLFSRLDFLCRKHEVRGQVKAHLHLLRIHTNRGSGHEHRHPECEAAEIALARFVEQVCGVPIPSSLKGELPNAIEPGSAKGFTGRDLRVVVHDCRDGVLFVTPDDDSLTPFQLHKGDHVTFADTFDAARQGDVLSLIDVSENLDRGEGYYQARLVVYQPDYLVDVSSLAACVMKVSMQHVASEALWFINRFSESERTIPLFLGNLVNTFFDALVSAPNDPPEFTTLFAESFTVFPMEYVRLFPEDHALVAFMNSKAKAHYTNLRRVVQHDFPRLNPPIPPVEPLIEPAFMAPQLGLQGRLDLLHWSGRHAAIVELKSGKLPYPAENNDALNESHAAQARLYQMLVNRVMGTPFKAIHVYLLYSSGNAAGSNLRYVVRYAEAEQKLIALRNRIVCAERVLAEAETAEEVLDEMMRWNLNARLFDDSVRLPEWFSGMFLQFQNKLARLTPLVRDYLGCYVSFIAREQWLARVGDGRYRLGHAALWNKDDAEGVDAADRLGPMTICENRMSEHPPRMVLKLTGEVRDDHDFRRGDICVFFPTDDPASTAVQRQVIKAYLVEEPNAEGELTLGFRNPQQHTELFDAYRLWSIEHDYLDQSFTGMQRELFSFATSPDRLHDLILGQTPPEAPTTIDEVTPPVNDAVLDESRAELRDLLSKALAAPDYFLLVGPPGTGKTSMFLANLIRLAHDRGEQVLLLAYTNRAVDEICEAIETALGGSNHYFRIGSGSTGDPRYEQGLLHRQAAKARSRAELKALIASRRVVVATVSSILNRGDIFALKRFDRIVIDEASQVLEPLLVNILRNAQRFVLIGDDKQLPAVVAQSETVNRLLTPRMKAKGMTDLRASLFERLLRKVRAEKLHYAWGTLRFQGRMHPEIGKLVGEQWYGGQLHPAGRPHQLEAAEFEHPDSWLNRRLVFIDGGERELGLSRKVNPQEAAIIAQVVAEIARVHDLAGNRLAESVGVIAPYRNQIGRIKHTLAKMGLDGAEAITVDTVERYQGSQRDYIIYGTTITSIDQLAFLTAQTRISEYDGIEVDRKLNVAITRARKQFVMVGRQALLNQHPCYAVVIQHIARFGRLMVGHDLINPKTRSNTVPF